jgi:hypothetical protein
MKARLLQGLKITLDEEDRSRVEKERELECKVEHSRKEEKPSAILKVVGEVSQRRGPEERGFHLEISPQDASYGEVEEYRVYLSEENYHDLTDSEDPVKGRSFVSRCKIDRVTINYWP